MMQEKQPLPRDREDRSIERVEQARRQHQQALLAVSRQCLPHGSGIVSDVSLVELGSATTELRAAKTEAVRAIRDIFHGARRR